MALPADRPSAVQPPILVSTPMPLRKMSLSESMNVCAALHSFHFPVPSRNRARLRAGLFLNADGTKAMQPVPGRSGAALHSMLASSKPYACASVIPDCECMGNASDCSCSPES
ncbi:hypothetical protein [Sphingobium lignivorans]|uniref:Uncharacterized protein n=1 Tax=Sphingobium lignivorans TaxID=2735886 RepID=A0ABR6NH93_9SPHN|nr:hypothetical protein [Sphingobium lignivorans]MBB5986641.1 hypothetical protein [Sphingobium lignivorans]